MATRWRAIISGLYNHKMKSYRFIGQCSVNELNAARNTDVINDKSTVTVTVTVTVSKALLQLDIVTFGTLSHLVQLRWYSALLSTPQQTNVQIQRIHRSCQCQD